MKFPDGSKTILPTAPYIPLNPSTCWWAQYYVLLYTAQEQYLMEEITNIQNQLTKLQNKIYSISDYLYVNYQSQ